MQWLKGWKLALIGSLVIVLGACGDSGQQSEKVVDQAGQQTEATRKFETVMGEIEIPKEPKRIVATQYLGHLLTLGVKPVGAGTASLNQYFLQDLTDGIEDIGDDQAALEKIVSLDPDLIIRPSDKNYEQFAKIAPTIVIPWGAKDLYAELREFGDFLGKSEEAEEVIRHYEEKLAEARIKLNSVVKEGETVGVYEIWAKNFWVVGERFGRGTRNLYSGLGYQPPEAVKGQVVNGGAGLDISLESLPDMAADYMFVTVYDADGGGERANEILESALWKSLPAYKNNRIFTLDINQLSAGDLISLEKQLEIQTNLLLGNVK
ncbi:iron complex transport system substrate-binding protein [Paenibacillus sp. cl141a]|uniref:ABC transporter substrate-binding protein n=1 Tax=Paenibacillus sp. cl141a TaxID=1761877 RepID=UPI0008AAF238|nr:ABC transporter substrate-binding protein [Paenibacillus sp. cl141a]SEM54058.1 iron complex transport system substrate-binding protein [Paenibacillus sp. cl141a]